MDHFQGSSKLVLFLDFHKAFDSISHKFIFTLLKAIGLPDSFVKWVCIMYTNMVSVVCHKNWLTLMISIGQGVCQGCPLSCHLFNLVGQVLIYYLRDNNFFSWWPYPSEPSSLYADDIALLAELSSQLALLTQAIQTGGIYRPMFEYFKNNYLLLCCH